MLCYLDLVTSCADSFRTSQSQRRACTPVDPSLTSLLSSPSSVPLLLNSLVRLYRFHSRGNHDRSGRLTRDRHSIKGSCPGHDSRIGNGARQRGYPIQLSMPVCSPFTLIYERQINWVVVLSEHHCSWTSSTPPRSWAGE